MKSNKEERISKLVKLCHFYRGDSVAPYYLSPIAKICWQYEKEWAESLAESYTNRDKYIAYYKKRFNDKPLDFHLKLNMPKSLFCYFLLKCDSDCFIHEWIHAPFELFSERYSGNSADDLMYDFLGVKNPYK